MAQKGVLVLLALMVASIAIASAIDAHDNVQGSLVEEQSAVTSENSESSPPPPRHKHHHIAHAHKKRVDASVLSASVDRKNLLGASGDNGVTKPWEFFATNYSLTVSWIAFSIIIVISCFLGGIAGWCTRKACGERKSHSFDVNTDAHKLYS